MEGIDIYVNPKLSSAYHTISEALLANDAGYDEDTAEERMLSGLKPGELMQHEVVTNNKKHFPEEYSDLPRMIFHIASGTYRERIVITRPNVEFIGESADDTVIIYGKGANEVLSDGTKRGTFRTATVRIDTHDFGATNISFVNDAGYGHTVGQALALYVDGDRNSFTDCRLIASQDTLFTAPLPKKEAKPGGFKGPGEFTERVIGRHYFKKCFIQGDVDFIFGSAIALFEDCEIYSKKPGDRKPPESPEDDITYGYVTAASTYEDMKFGYVFKNCRLTSDCPDSTIYLGRPWREWAKTVFMNCELGSHIKPAGWQDWNKDHSHFFYGEYSCTGAGADTSKRADFGHILEKEDVSEYTNENILQGWNPTAFQE
ncbi:MAG: pectin methylesterase [Lachnospiraceae bacterium]|nr:pectin methylesterase [Lachnospiraceae bacterium]